VTGDITVPGQLQIYQFTGQVGERIAIDGLPGSGGDIRYSLVDPNGSYLVNLAYRNDFQGPYRLTVPGPYQLLVTGNGDNTGTYKFQLVHSTDVTTPLAFDVPQTGSIPHAGDRHVYTFNATSGERLFLDGLAGSGGDIHYTLIGPSGERLVNLFRNDNSPLLRLHETGAYQIVVAGNGDNTGTYSFNLVHPGLVTAPLTFDTPVTGTIDKPGDERIYTFTASRAAEATSAIRSSARPASMSLTSNIVTTTPAACSSRTRASTSCWSSAMATIRGLINFRWPSPRWPRPR
jgi:hypothetical protein